MFVVIAFFSWILSLMNRQVDSGNSAIFLGIILTKKIVKMSDKHDELSLHHIVRLAIFSRH